MSSYRNRLLSRVTAPAYEPMTLAEAKLYLRINTVSEDSLISDLIVAARMAAESYLSRSLITQTWKLAYNDYIPNTVFLPMGPVIAITNVTIYNPDGSSQIVDSVGYYLNAAKDSLVMNSPLFALNIGIGSRIEITYTAGYGDSSAVPKPIKFGMLAHMAALYDSRGTMSDGMLPEQSSQLYAPFREMKL
jgi:uncharacterized phiE125 gp8 family phage protein